MIPALRPNPTTFHRLQPGGFHDEESTHFLVDPFSRSVACRSGDRAPNPRTSPRPQKTVTRDRRTRPPGKIDNHSRILLEMSLRTSINSNLPDSKCRCSNNSASPRDSTTGTINLDTDKYRAKRRSAGTIVGYDQGTESILNPMPKGQVGTASEQHSSSCNT